MGKPKFKDSTLILSNTPTKPFHLPSHTTLNDISEMLQPSSSQIVASGAQPGSYFSSLFGYARTAISFVSGTISNIFGRSKPKRKRKAIRKKRKHNRKTPAPINKEISFATTVSVISNTRQSPSIISRHDSACAGFGFANPYLPEFTDSSSESCTVGSYQWKGPSLTDALAYNVPKSPRILTQTTPLIGSNSSSPTKKPAPAEDKKKIEALEQELADLRKQIAMLIQNREVDTSELQPVSSQQSNSVPMTAPPPPPPPPPLPPPPKFHEIKITKSNKISNSIPKEKKGLPMQDILKEMSTVKLRKVASTSSSRKPIKSVSTNPQDIIAQALRKKFARVHQTWVDQETADDELLLSPRPYTTRIHPSSVTPSRVFSLSKPAPFTPPSPSLRPAVRVNDENDVSKAKKETVVPFAVKLRKVEKKESAEERKGSAEKAERIDFRSVLKKKT